jgi:hypothetical protein
MCVTKIIPPADKIVIGYANSLHRIPYASMNSLDINEVVAPVSNKNLPGYVKC